MEYRDFQGVKIAEVGLGTWQLGSADWGNVNEEDAFKILKAYTEHGGNFIDTADVYGMGVSETTIGKFLKTESNTIFNFLFHHHWYTTFIIKFVHSGGW